MRLMFSIAAGLSMLTASASLQGQTPKTITIGTSHQLESRRLGEVRTINVVVPAGYGKDTVKRYPVIYLIDGGVDQDLLHVAGVAQLGAMWGRTRDAVVVGVETKDRRRELVGPTRDPDLIKKFPTAGSSAAFRSYLRDEVKPLIERSYRTNGDDIIIGESLAGLFVVESFLNEPALFDGYAAIDPSLWWDREAQSRTAAAKIGPDHRGKRLFVAMAKEQSEAPTAMDRFMDSVRRSGAIWCLSARPDLTHATIYQQVTPQAFQFVLPPGEAPPPEFGFEVQCSAKS